MSGKHYVRAVRERDSWVFEVYAWDATGNLEIVVKRGEKRQAQPGYAIDDGVDYCDESELDYDIDFSGQGEDR